MPTTCSVKVDSKHLLYQILEGNSDIIEQMHVGTVNDRYIASAALTVPHYGLPILKILERRPGSSDPIGLDSIDYLYADLDKAFELLQAAGLPVEKENNDMHAWLSLRFGENKQFEAKITDHIVLEVAVKEMKLQIEQILAQYK